MCCDNKCLGFIPVRIASLVFAYIVAIISACGTLLSFIGIFIGLSLLIKGERVEKGLLLGIPILIQFTSSFVCSVLLLVGLTQKRPKLVTPYLIYGLIQAILLLGFFIVLCCISEWFYTDHLFLAILVLVIYSVCLFLVYLEYQRLVAEINGETIQPSQRSMLPDHFHIVV